MENKLNIIVSVNNKDGKIVSKDTGLTISIIESLQHNSQTNIDSFEFEVGDRITIKEIINKKNR